MVPISILLPPATKLRQGNVFTSVCQEFCPQGGGGGVSVPACTTGHMTRRVSVWGASVQGGLCPGGGGSLSRGRGIYVQGGLCLEAGSLSGGGVSVWGGVSVQGEGLYPGGSLSRGRVSVQGKDLCPGGGSLSRGSLSRGVSVQVVSVGGSLSRGVSVQRGSLSRGSLLGSPPDRDPTPIR